MTASVAINIDYRLVFYDARLIRLKYYAATNARHADKLDMPEIEAG